MNMADPPLKKSARFLRKNEKTLYKRAVFGYNDSISKREDFTI